MAEPRPATPSGAAGALYPGFEYPACEVAVTPQAQAEKLACCNASAGIFGDRADISAFAMETIMAARRAGISINGSVHVGQTFELRQPIYLNERLTLSGVVCDVTPEPRGALVTSRFELSRPDGSVPLALERISLRIDPAGATKGPRGRGASDDVGPEGLRHVARRQLEPEKVARFSAEAENLIHSDPEVARRFGFRAPIAGGLMAVRMMMEALWRDGPVAELRMAVRFRRPMFWDETLDVYARDDGGAWPRAMAVRRADGKLASEAAIEHLVRG